MCTLRVWQLPFRLPPLCWCWPTLSGWYYWTSPIHHHGHKPVSPKGLEWTHWTSSVASTHVSQHSMPRKEAPSVALGAPPSTEEQKIPSSKRRQTQPSPPWWQPSHRPQWLATPGDIPSLTHTVPKLLQLTLVQTLEMVSISFIFQHQTPPRVGPDRLTNEFLQLQKKMNVSLEWLLTSGPLYTSHHKELELNAELVAHLNEAQVVESIKAAKVHHTATIKEDEVCQATATYILQQLHRENVLMIKVQGKGRRKARPPSLCGDLWGSLTSLSTQNLGSPMYPLQLLTYNMLLAIILGMSATPKLEAISARGPGPSSSIPIVSKMLAPQGGTKHWHHSVVPNHTTEEWPCQKQERGEASSKGS